MVKAKTPTEVTFRIMAMIRPNTNSESSFSKVIIKPSTPHIPYALGTAVKLPYKNGYQTERKKLINQRPAYKLQEG